MNHPLPQNIAADPLSAPSSAELLRDWTGRVNSHALFDVACELYVNEQFEHAAVLFRYLLAFRTRSVAVWSWLGACLEAQGEPENAVLVYEAALSAFAAEERNAAHELPRGHSVCTPEQREEFVTRISVLRVDARRVRQSTGGAAS